MTTKAKRLLRKVVIIMNYAYNVSGKDRKKLVNIIAETISETANYANAPTYNFHIGEFTVTREGILEVGNVDEEQINSVIAALNEAGFDYENSDIISISYPLEGFSDEALQNLEKLIASKATLIKKALEIDELPIEVSENEIAFPWFKVDENTHAYSQFISQLCKTSKSKKRVTATAPESFENEKFTMRVWLIGLGLVGKEYSVCRKLLMQNLSGNSSWRFTEPQNGESKPRRERVHKEVVSVRFTPEILEQLAELAKHSNMSRNQLIESVVCEYVQAEFTAITESE